MTGITDPATSGSSALLMLMAMPTMVPFLALDVDPVIAAVAGTVTSLPLWFFVGTRLAVAARSWPDFWKRYLFVAIGWAVLSIVLLAIAASITE
ncbi:MAG TPA: hypothetical protein VLG28_10985 [Acidimicrobiia bacterium]|nr:hypothetical protein [Acidimicrobiia bacterium]